MDSELKDGIKYIVSVATLVTVRLSIVVLGVVFWMAIAAWWVVPLGVYQNMWWLFGILWSLVWIPFAGTLLIELWEIYGQGGE